MSAHHRIALQSTAFVCSVFVPVCACLLFSVLHIVHRVSEWHMEQRRVDWCMSCRSFCTLLRHKLVFQPCLRDSFSSPLSGACVDGCSHANR